MLWVSIEFYKKLLDMIKKEDLKLKKLLLMKQMKNQR